MYIVKVLGKVHEHEHMEDMILDLMEQAEIAYNDYEDFTEFLESRRRRIAYERAILECFRLATMK